MTHHPVGSGPLPAAGWYADPMAPQGRTGRRYWDGGAWTDQVVADPLPWTAAGPPLTPDGQQLAGWGRRLAAYLIDAVVAGVIALAVGFPIVRELFRREIAYFRQTMDTAAAGGQPPGQLDIYQQIYPQLLQYAGVGLVVVVLYYGLCWRYLSATPGKLALGLRLRLRETPGRLPWSAIAKRLLVTYVGATVIGLIPLVGGLVGLYFLLDGLWPLWDDKRQALHDKLAGTAVVRV